MPRNLFKDLMSKDRYIKEKFMVNKVCACTLHISHKWSQNKENFDTWTRLQYKNKCVFLSSSFLERFSVDIKSVILKFSQWKILFCFKLSNFCRSQSTYIIYEIVQRYNVLCIVPFVHKIFNILSKDSFDKKFLSLLT